MVFWGPAEAATRATADQRPAVVWGLANFRAFSLPSVPCLRGVRPATPTALCHIAPGCPSAGCLGFWSAPPTPTEVVASRAGALCVEGTLRASATCPCHNPRWGWGRGAFSQGSLG